METKKLTRSIDDRMLAGVAAGLADYVNMDPTLMRIIFALGTLFTGFWLGFIIYLILWIVMPEA